MRESNEEVLSGKRGLPFAAQSRRYPGGVPEQLLFPVEPFYFIQTPKQLWMIWKRDHMVRRVAFCGIHVISPQLLPKLTEDGAFSIIDSYLRLVSQEGSILV